MIAGLLCGVVPAAGKSLPNVVVITIDTLRADHLACYGYKRIKTPNIDQLAESDVRFAHAYAAVPITLPSHTVLMASQYLMATGIYDFSGNNLAPGSMTLARVLQAWRYSTAFIGSGARPVNRSGRSSR